MITILKIVFYFIHSLTRSCNVQNLIVRFLQHSADSTGSTTWLFSQGLSLPLAPSDNQLDKSEPGPYRTGLSFMSQLTPLNFVHRIKAECMYDDEEARWILPAMKIEKTSLPAAGNNQN